MDDRPRMVLKELIGRYGVSLTTDPRRTEGLLRDTCGSYPREIFVLVNAARQNVPADLLLPRHSLPLHLLLEFLAKRLRDELGLSDDASRWAVDSWAGALGLDAGMSAQELVKKPKLPEISEPLSAPQPDHVSVVRRRQWADDLESAYLETRLVALANLSHTMDPENIRLLIGALENGNWQVRAGAFDALYTIGKAAVPLLCEALADTNDEIVWRICLLLGALRAHQAIGMLIPLLDRKGIIRECTIWSLGEIGDGTASTVLLKFISSDDPVIQREAETALAKIGNAALMKKT
jgi:HEAT repeat protein